MEDYTYHLGPGPQRDPRRPHARGLPVASPTAHADRRDPPARHRRPGGPGAPGVRRRPGPGARRRPAPTSATASAWWPTRSTSSRRTSRCRSCRSRARSGSRAPTCSTSAECWLIAGGPHHTVLSAALGVEALDDFAEHRRHRAARHRRGTTIRDVPVASCAGTPRTTASPRDCSPGAARCRPSPGPSTGAVPSRAGPPAGDDRRRDARGGLAPDGVARAERAPERQPAHPHPRARGRRAARLPARTPQRGRSPPDGPGRSAC